ERAARTYLAAHLPAGATLGDFSVVANQLDGGLRTVAFQQSWRGLRIVDATVAIVFGHSPDGDRLFAVRSNAASVNPRIEAFHGSGELVVLEHDGAFQIAQLRDE